MTDLARSTATMTGLTLLARLTGLVRNVVVVAVLGDTFLGNTYQSANMVPNLLFELLAAGVLQAALIPTLVELTDGGRSDEADHVAGSVLGLAGAALATLAALGMVAAPWVMRLLVSGVDDAVVRDDQVRLGTVLLWCFLPQVVLYAANMVATGALNARGHFAVPVFAPLLNNVVVVASYGLFWLLRDGAEPSLDLSGAQQLVLGLGTTLGVVTFCLAPVVAARRAGVSLRPRFDHRHPAVRRVARLGTWAALFLAGTQVLLLVVLVLANRVEGGVVVWQLAFTIFLLPHALVALPVLTALFPTMSRHAAAGDDGSYGRAVGAGVSAVVYLAVPASAAMLALGLPLARALRFGELAADGVDQVAGTIAAFGPGVVGYGCFLLLARALYATGDTKTPAVVNLGVVAAGSIGMVAMFAGADGDGRVVALAATHSAAYVAGAFTLYAVVRGRSVAVGGQGVGRVVAAAAGAAFVAGLVMWFGTRSLDGVGRGTAVVELVVLGAVGVVVYIIAAAGLGGPRPTSVPSLLRGGDG